MLPTTKRAKVAIPIRVRGMSSQQKFFDEQTETCAVDSSLVITRLRNLVDLETEVHVTSLKSNLGGTFRVVWTNLEGRDGWHDIGLEVADVQGDLWEADMTAGADTAGAQAFLQCQHCHSTLLMTLPEAEDEFIGDGFVIARPCEKCKATTPWAFTPVETRDESYAHTGKDGRHKGRAPIEMPIKIIRQRYNSISEEVCMTINVSRQGVYFLTKAMYSVGEEVKVIVPYKEGDVAIPVPARVVRQDHEQDNYFRGVALRLERENK